MMGSDDDADLTLEQRLALSLTYQAALAVTQRFARELREAGVEGAARAVDNAVQAIRHVQLQLTDSPGLDDEGNTDENTP